MIVLHVVILSYFNIFHLLLIINKKNRNLQPVTGYRSEWALAHNILLFRYAHYVSLVHRFVLLLRLYEELISIVNRYPKETWCVHRDFRYQGNGNGENV